MAIEQLNQLKIGGFVSMSSGGESPWTLWISRENATQVRLSLVWNDSEHPANVSIVDMNELKRKIATL